MESKNSSGESIPMARCICGRSAVDTGDGNCLLGAMVIFLISFLNLMFNIFIIFMQFLLF